MKTTHIRQLVHRRHWLVSTGMLTSCVRCCVCQTLCVTQLRQHTQRTACHDRRGKATERQDQHVPLVHHVVEGSEELRLSLCRMVGRMLAGLMSRGTIGILRPYLDDTILFLVSQCRDPYSTVKMEALEIIGKLAAHPHLEQVRHCLWCQW